jgi:hypothetical protein
MRLARRAAQSNATARSMRSCAPARSARIATTSGGSSTAPSQLPQRVGIRDIGSAAPQWAQLRDTSGARGTVGFASGGDEGTDHLGRGTHAASTATSTAIDPCTG